MDPSLYKVGRQGKQIKHVVVRNSICISTTYGILHSIKPNNSNPGLIIRITVSVKRNTGIGNYQCSHTFTGYRENVIFLDGSEHLEKILGKRVICHFQN
jgi:hypothetical protein